MCQERLERLEWPVRGGSVPPALTETMAVVTSASPTAAASYEMQKHKGVCPQTPIHRQHLKYL